MSEFNTTPKVVLIIPSLALGGQRYFLGPANVRPPSGKAWNGEHKTALCLYIKNSGTVAGQSMAEN